VGPLHIKWSYSVNTKSIQTIVGGIKSPCTVELIRPIKTIWKSILVPQSHGKNHIPRFFVSSDLCYMYVLNRHPRGRGKDQRELGGDPGRIWSLSTRYIESNLGFGSNCHLGKIGKNRDFSHIFPLPQTSTLATRWKVLRPLPVASTSLWELEIVRQSWFQVLGVALEGSSCCLHLRLRSSKIKKFSGE